jgi:hypothetical protein
VTGNEFNHAVVIVGLPRHGKTSIARDEVSAHLSTYPHGRALVHDPQRQFRDLCATFDDVAHWRRELQAAIAAKQPFPHGASIGGEGKAVRDAAVELGKLHNTADNVRVPIMLVYDESSLMGTGSGPTWMDGGDTALLSNRAHWGIATIYNVQRPTALPESFYTMATRVVIFSQPSERRTRVLEEYLGLADGALLELVGAPPYKHLVWESGKGIV